MTAVEGDSVHSSSGITYKNNNVIQREFEISYKEDNSESNTDIEQMAQKTHPKTECSYSY